MIRSVKIENGAEMDDVVTVEATLDGKGNDTGCIQIRQNNDVIVVKQYELQRALEIIRVREYQGEPFSNTQTNTGFKY